MTTFTFSTPDSILDIDLSFRILHRQKEWVVLEAIATITQGDKDTYKLSHTTTLTEERHIDEITINTIVSLLHRLYCAGKRALNLDDTFYLFVDKLTVALTQLALSPEKTGS